MHYSVQIVHLIYIKTKVIRYKYTMCSQNNHLLYMQICSSFNMQSDGGQSIFRQYVNYDPCGK